MRIKHKNISIILYSAILFFLLPSCNDETEVNMGQGYYYIPFQEVTFDVTMFGGNGIYIYKDSFTVPIIYPNVSKYKFDSSYIVVKQNFDITETKYLLESMIFHPIYFKYYENFVPLDKNYVTNAPVFNNSGLEEKYVDSVMYIDSHIKKIMEHKENYYIIDKTKKEVIGPLTKTGFDEKRKVMHLSDKLKLD